MIRILTPLALCAALVACGDGTPFNGAETDVTQADGETTTTSTIPELVAGDVTAFNYDPVNETLTLTANLTDGDEVATTYRRRSGLDLRDRNTNAVVYQAYTAQARPLSQHTTVFVRELGNVSAAVAVTGGQFRRYTGGTNYTRTGDFDPIALNETAPNQSGLETYAGEYAGLTNLNGPNTDLEAVDPTTNPSVIPTQAAPITGTVFITVSYAENSVNGKISERVVSSLVYGDVNLADLTLRKTTLSDDGTFAGSVLQDGSDQELGEYGGLIGGTDGASMAGAIFVDEHFGDDLVDSGGNAITITGEDEYGIFVLGRCGGPLEDSSIECTQNSP